jgi:hypothetical protein
MKTITASDINSFEKRYRTSLINSLSGIRTAFIGITADDRGRFNAATLSNITHVGAHPAQMSILFRPDNGKRHTLSNYRNQGQVTLVCMPLSKSVTVHEVSMNAPDGIFELEIVGESYKEYPNWPHPLPTSFLYAIELEFIEEFTLNNGCVYTVGKIQNIVLGDNVQVCDQGRVIFKQSPALALGLQQYTGIASDSKHIPYPSASKYGF